MVGIRNQEEFRLSRKGESMTRKLNKQETLKFLKEAASAESIESISDEVANRFPMASKDSLEFSSLKDGISSAGRIKEPIELFDGKVLDGRNRLQVALALELPPDAVPIVSIPEAELCGATKSEHVLACNADRRQLSKTQASFVALDYLPEYEKQARKRQKNKDKQGRAVDVVGKRFRISGDTVQAAKRVVKNAPPELLDLARADKITITALDYFLKKVTKSNPGLLEKVMKANDVALSLIHI